MKSDHWNFLANLLGAPGAADPPTQPSKAETPKATEPAKKDALPAAGHKNAPNEGAVLDPKTESQPAKRVVDPLAFTSFRDLDDDDEPIASSAPQPTRPVSSTSGSPTSRESKAPTEAARQTEPTRARGNTAGRPSEPISGEDVLQALTAVTPPPRLPGFGVPSEPEPSREKDVFEPVKKETSMWGRIAEKFGVGGDRKAERDEEPVRSTPPVAEKPKQTSSRSGFGGGLIDDVDDDAEADVLPAKGFSAPRDEKVGDADDDFGRPRRDANRDSSSRDSSSRDNGGRNPRGRASHQQESPGNVSSSRGPESRDSSRDAQRDNNTERGRTRRTIARGDVDEDSDAIEVDPLDAPIKDEPTGRSSRRRGRRGIRQRMSDDDIDQSASPVARKGGDVRDSGRSHEIRSDETSEREGGSRHAGSSRKDGSTREVASQGDSDSSREKSASHRDTEEGRGRGRNRGRGRGRGGETDQSRDQAARTERGPRNDRGPSRHRDHDLPSHDDAFVGDDDSSVEIDAEFDEIDDDGFGAGLVATNRDDPSDDKATDGESARGPRSRSRRRGRRGRGRGNAETTQAASVPASDFDEPDSDDGIIEANFDDDHEDDDQVEEIRRGSRRRPRSRRSGRTENADGSADSAAPSREEPVRTGRDSRPRDTQPRDSQPRESQARDVEFGDLESADVEGTRRRSNVPTWLETVELLVNANIENHNKAGSKGHRGGRGGNNGGGNGGGGRRR